jgi:hypothetical protein
MVGRLTDEYGLWVTGLGTAVELDTMIRDLDRPNGLTSRFILSGVSPTDSKTFHEAGYPVVNFITGLHSDYHTDRDTPDRINYEGMVLIAEYSIPLLSELANRDSRLSYQRNTDEVDRRVLRTLGPRDFDSHLGGLYLGYSWLSGPGSIAELPEGYDFLETIPWKSIQTGWNFWVRDVRLIPHVGLTRSLGLELSVFSFSGNDPLLPGSGSIEPNTSYTNSGIDLKKNSLSTLKLTLPLAVEFSSRTHGGSGFYLLAGVTGSLRLMTWTKATYKSKDYKTKDKVWGDFNCERFDYGAFLRAGYGPFGLYGRVQLSPMFDRDSGKALYPLSIGVTINSF